MPATAKIANAEMIKLNVEKSIITNAKTSENTVPKTAEDAKTVSVSI